MNITFFDTTEGGSERHACHRSAARARARRQRAIRVALIAAACLTANGQTQIDLRTQAKSVDFSAATLTKPSRVGTVLPATCSAGETYLKIDAPSGQNLYVCTSGNVWSLQGTPIPGVTGYANTVLATDGTTLLWKALEGDVSGSPSALKVTGIQGRAVAATAPTNGQSLVWNSSTSQWQPQAQSGGVSSVFGRSGAIATQSGDYSFPQISGTISDPQVGTGVNANKIGGGSVSNAAFSYLSNVTSDIQAQLNAKADTSQSMGGDLTGTLASTTVAAIQHQNVSPATPSNGQVLTWNVATNRWEPQALPDSSSGTYSSSFVSQTTVSIPGTLHQLGTANLLVGCYDASVPNMRVQSNTVSVNPSTYDVTVTFSTAQSGRCVLTAGGGGGSGSGGGASMASQLGDFGVAWTSGSVLTVGPNCSAATPCNVRIGTNVFRYVNGTAITLTAGTGAAYIFIDINGILTVRHNLALSCASPCVSVPGTNSFPVNSVPLYTWTATGGSWDAAGGVDERALLNSKVLTAGAAAS
jgi:hypothetical protein